MKRDSVVNLASLIGVGGGNAEAGEGHRGSLASKKSAASTIYEAKGVTAMVAFTKVSWPGFIFIICLNYFVMFKRDLQLDTVLDT